MKKTSYRISDGRVYHVYHCRDTRKKFKKPLITTGTELAYACLYSLLAILVVLLIAMNLVDVYFSYKMKDLVDCAPEEATSHEDHQLQEVLYTASMDEMYGAAAPPPVQDIHMAEQSQSLLIPTSEEILISNIGDDQIEINGTVFNKYKLPTDFYGPIDHSSFQPFMDYRKVTDTHSAAYKVCNSSAAYVDENGLLRYQSGDVFNLGIDDYVVAMGTFYKPKGTAGSRFLIVTETGMFTVRTGDEKADKDTDAHNMFTMHRGGTVAAILEWIVNEDLLNASAMKHGNVVEIESFEALHGKILYVYGINE